MDYLYTKNPFKIPKGKEVLKTSLANYGVGHYLFNESVACYRELQCGIYDALLILFHKFCNKQFLVTDIVNNGFTWIEVDIAYKINETYRKQSKYRWITFYDRNEILLYLGIVCKTLNSTFDAYKTLEATYDYFLTNPKKENEVQS